MAISQFHPYQRDPKSGELYLPLRKHKNYILTPFRDTDTPENVEILNDWSVSQWLGGPAYPYREEDAKRWSNCRREQGQKSLKAIAAAEGNEELVHVDDCLVEVIRENREDGTTPMIGAVNIVRCSSMEAAYPGPINWEGRAALTEENNSRSPGDPDIVWSIGYLISPKYQGKGIMTDAAETLLHDWAIPRMNVRKIVGVVFEGNPPSIRVLEKLGFKWRHTEKDYKEIKGKMRDLVVLDWSADASA